MDYFSDRERIIRPQVDIITNRVWGGIVEVINRFIQDNSLSKDFPLSCPDGNGVCGFNEDIFRATIRAEIPDMTYPFPSINECDPFGGREEIEEKSQYAAFDTIEFVYSHLCHAVKVKYHKFYDHYELSFEDGQYEKGQFRDQINHIFRRNGLLFILTNGGKINRILPSGATEAIAHIVPIQDETINGYIDMAIKKYKDPHFDENRLGLERLWDAFERIKTVYKEDCDKKQSMEALINKIAGGDDYFKCILNEDCVNLTKIGNSYHIRHHEVNKIPIRNKEILDYFFVRMLTTINLLMRGICE